MFRVGCFAPGAEAVSFRLHDAMGLVTILAGQQGALGGAYGRATETARNVFFFFVIFVVFFTWELFKL